MAQGGSDPRAQVHHASRGLGASDQADQALHGLVEPQEVALLGSLRHGQGGSSPPGVQQLGDQETRPLPRAVDQGEGDVRASVGGADVPCGHLGQGVGGGGSPALVFLERRRPRAVLVQGAGVEEGSPGWQRLQEVQGPPDVAAGQVARAVQVPGPVGVGSQVYHAIQAQAPQAAADRFRVGEFGIDAGQGLDPCAQVHEPPDQGPAQEPAGPGDQQAACGDVDRSRHGGTPVGRFPEDPGSCRVAPDFEAAGHLLRHRPSSS